MKKIAALNSESGMSLVSVMVASVLGIILFMGITSGIQSMYAAQKNVDMASTAMNMSDQLRIRFDSPKACTDSLINSTYTPSGSNSISGITVSVDGTSRTLTNGAEIAPGLGWSVVSIDLETSNSSAQALTVDLNDTPTTTKSYKKYAGTIKIQFRRTDGNGPPPSPVYIPVVFLGDDSTFKIASCGQTAMGQVMCRSMGYIWRGDLTPPVCQKANECVYGGTYVHSSIPAAQGGFDNPLTGARSCIDASYTPIRSGTVTYANKTGKYGFQSIVGEVYDCMRCVDANGNVTAPTAPAALTFDPDWNADPDAVTAETQTGTVDGSLGGPCTASMPPWPPYWMTTITYNVPCMHTTTTTTTTLPPGCPGLAAGAVPFGTTPYVLCYNDSAVPATPSGGSVLLVDTNAGDLKTGSATMNCSSGTWQNMLASGGCSFVTTTTTTTTLPGGSCPSVTYLSLGAWDDLWGTFGGPVCRCNAVYGSLPIGSNNQVVIKNCSRNVGPDTYTGDGVFKCTSGAWTLQPSDPSITCNCTGPGC